MIGRSLTKCQTFFLFYFPWPFLRQNLPNSQFDNLFRSLLHNMFRPSGPDHVLINTEQFWFMAHQKWRWAINQNIKRGYKEKVKVTTWTIDLLAKTQIALQGLCSPPSQDLKIPLLHCPELLLAELFSSSSSSIWLGPRIPESAELPSSLQAMGATWLSHGLEDRVGIPGERDTSSLWQDC